MGPILSIKRGILHSRIRLHKSFAHDFEGMLFGRRLAVAGDGL